MMLPTLSAMHLCHEEQVAVDDNPVARMRLPCPDKCKSASYIANVANANVLTKKKKEEWKQEKEKIMWTGRFKPT